MVPVIDHKFDGVDDKQRKKTMESADHRGECEANPFYKYFSASSDFHGLRLFPRKDVDPNANGPTLAELLYGFFEFWAHFDYEVFQVSLHSRGMTKKQRWQFKEQRKGQLTFVIQDPVDTKHNVAKNVRPETAELLINEFKRAQLLLLYGGKWTDDVCRRTEGAAKTHPHCWTGETVHHQIAKFRSKSGLDGKTRGYVDEYIVSKYDLKFDLNGYGQGRRHGNGYENGNGRPRTPRGRGTVQMKRKEQHYLRRRKSSM